MQSAKRCNVIVSYHGHKWIVAKEDLNGDGLPLFSDGSHPKSTSSFYKCHIEAFNEFDMKSCTKHLREAGLAFELDTDLCIPTAGQLAAMYLYRKELNKALEMVGGAPMKKERTGHHARAARETVGTWTSVAATSATTASTAATTFALARHLKFSIDRI